MRRYDANGDNKITQNEHKAVSDVLRAGSKASVAWRDVDEANLSTLFNEIGGDITKADMISFFDEYDTNGDKRLNETEIGNLAQDYPEQMRKVGGYASKGASRFNSGVKAPPTQSFEVRQNKSVFNITNPNPPQTVNVNQTIRKLN